MGIIVLTSTLFTQWCLRESFLRGRLAASPSYDDVAYFYGGAELLNAIRNGHGISALSDYLHSPYSIILAATSFAIWGDQDWAPYAGNVVVVASYLALLSYFLRKLPLAPHLGLLAAFLAFPFATMAVVEFRPDVLWAILVGFLAVYLVTASSFSSRLEALTLGGMYGLAMMTKPSTFLMTTAVVGLGGLLRLVRDILARELALPTFVRWLSMFLVGAFAVAGPYYCLQYKGIWNYFYSNSFGEKKDIWISKQTLSEHLGYYVISPGASDSNLGNWRLPALLLIGIATAFGIASCKSSGQRSTFAFLFLLVIATWLASSLFGMKSSFLGGAFYGTAIFSAAYYIAAAWENSTTFLADFLLPQVLDRWRSRLGKPTAHVVIFVCLVGLALAMYSWPKYSDREKMASHERKANTAVWNEIRRAWKEFEPNDGVMDVYSSNTTPIPIAFLKFRALQRRVSCRFHGGSLTSSMEDQRKTLDECDVLVVQDAGLSGVNPNFPVERIQNQITSEALSDPDFELVREILWLDGRHIYVLRNKVSLIRKESGRKSSPHRG